ncbi:MAG: hypothetical protein U1F45_14095 [Burkholderiales bacterium]
MNRTTLLALLALVAGTLVALPASARCVRDVSESGAVGVRCSDGVRGRLATDDIAPAAPRVSLRSPASPLATRGSGSALAGSSGGGSALSGGPTAAGALSSGAGSPRGAYGGGRPGDPSGSLYSASRDAGAGGDRRP